MTKPKLHWSCRKCGAAFKPDNKRPAYCSDYCAWAAHVVIGAPDECWIWWGAKNSMGYGQLNRNGKRVYAHRLGYELRYGTLGTLRACHRCDTPLCCNPDHIFPGTQADNMADMTAKGRRNYDGAPSGERCKHSKLTEAEVRNIRADVESGMGIRPTARKFGVSQGAIHGIVRGRTWRQLIQ